MTSLVLIVGVPGVGKTTLFRTFLTRFQGEGEPFRQGMVFGYFYQQHHTAVLGTYPPDEVFAGTDRFSMQAQRDVPAFWKHATEQYPHTTFFGEGSRISTPSFVDATRSQNVDMTIVSLVAPQELIEARRKARSNQQPQWVKGMETRIKNLTARYNSLVIERENTTEQHIKENADFLLTLLGKQCHA